MGNNLRLGRIGGVGIVSVEVIKVAANLPPLDDQRKESGAFGRWRGDMWEE